MNKLLEGNEVKNDVSCIVNSIIDAASVKSKNKKIYKQLNSIRNEKSNGKQEPIIPE
jgi:hypothetical protein